jgi:hypothetical protein
VCRAASDHSRDRGKQRLGSIGFRQYGVGEPLERLRDLIKNSAAHHHGGRGLFFHNGQGNLIAIHSRHCEIEHNRINALPTSYGDTAGAIERNQNFVSIAFEEGPVKSEDIFVIVDAENGSHTIEPFSGPSEIGRTLLQCVRRS